MAHLPADALAAYVHLLLEQPMGVEWFDSVLSALPPTYQKTIPLPGSLDARIRLAFDKLNHDVALHEHGLPLRIVLVRLSREPLAAVSDGAAALLRRLPEVALRPPPPAVTGVERRRSDSR